MTGSLLSFDNTCWCPNEQPDRLGVAFIVVLAVKSIIRSVAGSVRGHDDPNRIVQGLLGGGVAQLLHEAGRSGLRTACADSGRNLELTVAAAPPLPVRFPVDGQNHYRKR